MNAARTWSVQTKLSIARSSKLTHSVRYGSAGLRDVIQRCVRDAGSHEDGDLLEYGTWNIGFWSLRATVSRSRIGNNNSRVSWDATLSILFDFSVASRSPSPPVSLQFYLQRKGFLSFSHRVYEILKDIPATGVNFSSVSTHYSIKWPACCCLMWLSIPPYTKGDLWRRDLLHVLNVSLKSVSQESGPLLVSH